MASTSAANPGMTSGRTNHKQHKSPVGAGLLAKAAYQSTLMSADSPLSRASPLPQGVGGGCK
ncbi:hypothetical protein BK665_13540 [Pseudomonas frederiksbergensis]|uniref:Uncharacterized protein n=1 Tax=Pseudomonas frederiksbergensis TaxID=104087 RepID=A0A423KKN7_9PSED|nr:hypothetical protein BK665_13540 [Pseudomonas frederiksbergensis]